MTRTDPAPATWAPTWRSRTAFWWILLSALAVVVLAPLPYALNSLAGLAAGGQEVPANYVDRPAAVVAAFYLLLPAFTSIRFLVPVFALLSLPAAAALVHLVLGVRPSRRAAVTAGVAVGVLGHVGFGVVKADRFLEQSAEVRQGDLDRAAALEPLVDGRPCLLASPVPHMAGYQLRCSVVMTVAPGPTAPSKVVAAIRDGSVVVALLDSPPAAGTFLASWRPLIVPDLPGSTTVYVPD